MFVSRRRFAATIVSVCALIGSTNAHGAGAPAKPILKILGLNNGQELTMTRDQFEEMELSRMTTETPWTDGEVVFEGVWGYRLIEGLGATGRSLIATAINDYSVEIPMDDFVENGVFFAISMNGKPLTVRTKGPIWALYPFSDHPVYRSPAYEARSIWQLTTLELQ